MGVPELIPAYDCQGAGVRRIIIMVITIVEIVIEDDDGPVMPAQRAPAVIIVSPVPMHPGRTPGVVRNPVPAQAQPPVPSSIMVCAPAPRFIRNPVPAAKRIPDPAAVIIGPPIRGDDIRNPDIAIRPFIGPGAVGVEFILVILELGGKIALRGILTPKSFAVFIPVGKIIAGVGESKPRTEVPIGSHQALPTADFLRPLFTGGLGRALDHLELGLAVFVDVHPVEALVKNIERGIGRVDFKHLLFFHVADAEVYLSS